MGSFWDHSGLIPRSFWDDFGITLGSFCGLRRVGNIAPRGLPPRSGPTGPTPSGEWRHPAPPGRIDLRVPSVCHGEGEGNNQYSDDLLQS